MSRALRSNHHFPNLVLNCYPTLLGENETTCASGAIRGALMRTFPAWQSRFTSFLSKVFAPDAKRKRRSKLAALNVFLLAAATLLAIAVVKGQPFSFIPNGVLFPNPGGASQTYSTANGGIDLTGPFFQSIGTNGRSCGTCHQPSDGMSVSAASVERRFELTRGEDPIFRTVDGSNCNHSIDVSNLAGRAAAYSLLRTRGLIRVAINVPTTADYQVVNVNN